MNHAGQLASRRACRRTSNSDAIRLSTSTVARSAANLTIKHWANSTLSSIKSPKDYFGQANGSRQVIMAMPAAKERAIFCAAIRKRESSASRAKS
uniref:Uncharacterized protein n=1 Tax=Romanomermis culicivorax TaxID=13658 RepID=A0A915KUR7_ROMCU